MNATPLLTQIAQALKTCRLEAVLIGNAAAALHGAPVTTLDFDFMFRATPTNVRKLKTFAKQFEAIVLRPYYPASGLYRVINDRVGLQVDFMAKVDGISSFASLRSRTAVVEFAGCFAGCSRRSIGVLRKVHKCQPRWRFLPRLSWRCC